MKIIKLFLAVIVATLPMLALSEVENRNESPGDGVQISTQDRQQIAFESMMTELKRLHGAIYSLPYSEEYIRTTLVPEVAANRAIIAPHYPTRESTSGMSSEEVYQQMRLWFETYPTECSAYLEYLNTFIASHSN